MAKTKRKKLVDKLDETISLYVRAKKPMCEHCGKKATQVHHYFGRSRYSVRWEEDNLISLCWACHRYWAHVYYEQCRDYLIGRIGQERFDELKVRSNQPALHKDSDLEMMHDNFKNKLDKLTS